MSSSDRAPRAASRLPTWHPRIWRLLPALALSAALAACTASPLYAPTGMTPGGPSIAAELGAISIPPPADRIEQQVRNDLIFAFTGGGVPSAPRYDLRLRTTVSQTLLGVTRIETAPSYSINVVVSYELVAHEDERIITRGVARGAASYDRSNQAFANVRAQRDAEDRAAAVAAGDIRIRLAAAFAEGR